MFPPRAPSQGCGIRPTPVKLNRRQVLLRPPPLRGDGAFTVLCTRSRPSRDACVVRQQQFQKVSPSSPVTPVAPGLVIWAGAAVSTHDPAVLKQEGGLRLIFQTLHARNAALLIEVQSQPSRNPAGIQSGVTQRRPDEDVWRKADRSGLFCSHRLPFFEDQTEFFYTLLS